jgi:hypothetical protein
MMSCEHDQAIGKVTQAFSLIIEIELSLLERNTNFRFCENHQASCSEISKHSLLFSAHVALQLFESLPITI